MEKSSNYTEFLLNPGKLESDEKNRLFLCGKLNNLYSSMTSKSNKNGNSEENKFIGAHPISLDRTNMINLTLNKYLLCEKTDGVRYFLIILNNGKVYLHGRNLKKNAEDQYKNELQFFLANIKIPINFIDTNSELRIKYLFDGELVLDTYGTNIQIKFLIFDTLLFDYGEVVNYYYKQRLECSRKFLSFYKMSKRLLKADRSINNNLLPYDNSSFLIKISLKDFFEIEDCGFLLHEYLKGLPHKQDGLVLTKIDSAYKPGRNADILKWKEASQQTIDFLMVNNEYFNSNKVLNGRFANRILDIYLIGYNKEFNTSERVLFDFMIVDEEKYEKVSNEIQKLQAVSETTVFGIIAECKFNKIIDNNFIRSVYNENPTNFVNFLRGKACFNQENNQNYQNAFEKNLIFYVENKFCGGWEVYGWRFDKSDPNAFETGTSIMIGIRNPIDKNELIQYVDQFCRGEQTRKKIKN